MNSRIGTILLTALVILAVPGLLWAQVQPQTAAVPVPETISTLGEQPIPDTPAQTIRTGLSDSVLRSALDSLGGMGFVDRVSPPSVLVVPAAQMSMEDLATVTEDMTVMSRIFQTKLETAPSTGYRPSSYGGYGGGTYGGYGGGLVLPVQGTRTLQSLYLQGYGALFTMEVGYPLAPGPESDDETAEEETESDVDSVWQEARMELLNPGATQRRQPPSEKGPQYSAAKVEELEKNVIEALKHASNIRALQSGDVVVVTITGKAPSVNSPVAVRDVVIVQDGIEVLRGDIPGQLQTQTVMTIRANIADIKSYAGGTLTAEQFRERVQVLTYPKLSSTSLTPVRDPLFNTGR